MITIVDAYNVLFAQKGGTLDASSAETARADLIRLLNRYAETSRSGLIAVFDATGPVGLPHRERHGLVTVVYAREAGKADAEVLRIVRSGANPGEFRVVTSDIGLARSCRHAGAEVVPSKDFLHLVEETFHLPHQKPSEEPGIKYQTPSPKEVEYWLEQFSVPRAKRKKR